MIREFLGRLTRQANQVITVYGVPEAVSAFKELPRSMRNKHMRIAMNAGGGIIRDDMVTRTPVDAGLLKRSYRVKVRVPDASYNIAHHGRPAYAVIGPSRNVVGVQTFRKSGKAGKVKLSRVKRVPKLGDFFTKTGLKVATDLQRPSRYFHLVDRGVKSHTISAKSSRVLSNSEAVFGRSVEHPGFSGRRIVQSSIAAAGPAAQTAIIRKLKVGLLVDAARLSQRRSMSMA